MQDNEILERVKEGIKKAKHPEIAMSLWDLGMVGENIVIDDQKVILTLKIPFMGIPEMIKSILIQRLEEPIKKLGLIPEISIEEMDEETRNSFFSKEQSNWTGM